MKKLMVLISGIGLTLLVGTKTFAAPTVNFNTNPNSGVLTQDVAPNGLSGSIDFYHPDTTPIQSKSDLQLNLNDWHHRPGPGRGPEGPGPRMGYGPPPGLWFYTLIGIVVVELLTRDDYIYR